MNKIKSTIAAVCMMLLVSCTTLGSSSMRRSTLYWPATSQHLTVSNSTVTYSLTPSSLCDSLDSSRRTWGAIAVAAGIGAGTTGGITALFSDSTPRAVTGSFTLAIAIFSAVSAYLANDYATSFTDHGCLNMTMTP